MNGVEKIRFNSVGSATFAGDVSVNKLITIGTSTFGSDVQVSGELRLGGADPVNAPNTKLSADGSAQFNGDIKSGTVNFFNFRPALGVCQIKTTSTTAAQSILYGQSEFGGSTFDAFKFTVDGSAEFASGKFEIESTGQYTWQPETDSGKISTTWSGGVDSSVELYAADKANVKKWRLMGDGGATFAGNIQAAGLTDGSTSKTMTEVLAGGDSFDFPSGTVMLFYQADAPTGFTKVTTQNNKALRVVSGNGGSTGGSVSFTDAFSDKSGSLSGATVGSTSLSTSQMPSHSHTQVANQGGSALYTRCQSTTASASQNTGSTGGSGSHTHTITGGSVSFNIEVEYIDVILASRD